MPLQNCGFAFELPVPPNPTTNYLGAAGAYANNAAQVDRRKQMASKLPF